ncbi:F-box/kelch-repeat protein At3g06240-like [Apium graveolens]|uniref:F-box/kelch-repeat protein At3g06240-like n=1 Tax=Apium graveolens TaxID=4045 RepID=UPI003D79E0D1
MSVTTITDLHENTFLEILCFLPAKYVIRCRCVCKDWANLIHQPYFSHLYFSRGKSPLQFLVEKDNKILLVQLDEALFITRSPSNVSVPRRSVFDLKIRQIFGAQHSVWLLVMTCKVTGWIVARNYDQAYHPCLGKQYFCQPYHMYNPITGQHIVVEQPKRDDLEWQCCALMYAQRTNQLKLLGFYRKNKGRLEADIQTIGTDTWRSLGEIPCHHYGYELPVFLNGHCHWLDYRNAVINCFDAEEEVFRVIQTPPCFKKYAWFNLGSLDGCLCLSLSTLGSVSDFDVWVMNEYGIADSWTKKFVVSNIQNMRAGAMLEPLTCLRNGEILMLGDRTPFIHGNKKTASTMICYDPQSRRNRYIKLARGHSRKGKHTILT